MTPTSKLRFIERTIPTPEYGENTGKIVRILQQWWETIPMTINLGWSGDIPLVEVKGEWRDVPLEKEE